MTSSSRSPAIRPLLSSRFIFFTIAFLNGALVMILELVGARLISPYFGNTFFVWSSLISVILAGLSIGYYFGGKLADRPWREQALLWLLWLNGLGICYIIFLKQNLFDYALTVHGEYWLIVLSTLLFAPATIIFGMISSLITRICLHNITDSGQTVGHLTAISTAGSIIGTLATGHLLFGLLGSTQILVLILLSIVLEYLLAWYATGQRKVIFLYLFILLVGMTVVSYIFTTSLNSPFLADIDTQYSRIIVTDIENNGEPIRIMINDQSVIQSKLNLNHPDQLEPFVYQLFDLAFELNEEPQKILVVGGGAFVYPQYLAKKYPNALIEVVEIDPALIVVARTFFLFENQPNLIVHHHDGRQFLLSTKEIYDLIFMDAYSGKYIPFHLTTKQFFSQVDKHLAEDGILIINIIGTQNPTKQKNLTNALFSTVVSVFSHATIVPTWLEAEPTKMQNQVLFASRQPLDLSSPQTHPEFWHAAWQPTAESFLLTDEFAPVEHLSEY